MAGPSLEPEHELRRRTAPKGPPTRATCLRTFRQWATDGRRESQWQHERGEGQPDPEHEWHERDDAGSAGDDGSVDCHQRRYLQIAQQDGADGHPADEGKRVSPANPCYCQVACLWRGVSFE